MLPYLTRLGVRVEVQEFFTPYISEDQTGALVFSYQDAIEHFGFAFHRVPVSRHLWLAGDTNFSLIRQVIISASAMETIAYLSLNPNLARHTDSLLFLSTGAKLDAAQIQWINRNLKDKAFTMLYSKDILGRISNLKLAAGIRRMPVAITVSETLVCVSFKYRTYYFEAGKFSLNAFEKAANYRFNIAAPKPKGFDSYLDQLKAGAFKFS